MEGFAFSRTLNHFAVLHTAVFCSLSCVSIQKKVPCRWYPPEYFKQDFYGFKGDVWAFGIVIWEMQTFGK